MLIFFVLNLPRTVYTKEVKEFYEVTIMINCDNCGYKNTCNGLNKTYCPHNTTSVIIYDNTIIRTNEKSATYYIIPNSPK